MSMDDSMGMNRTTVGQDSSDSMALSETSGDGMDMSLLSLPAASSKQTQPLGISLLFAPGNAAPRKSALPFVFNDGIGGGLGMERAFTLSVNFTDSTELQDSIYYLAHKYGNTFRPCYRLFRNQIFFLKVLFIIFLKLSTSERAFYRGRNVKSF